MEQVRLVAYRKATSGATIDTSYEFDLQESPNISLNFQFSDIKEPQTRKANYSQTFKLPFTDNNNDFFQNWFNVNMDTLVFSTRQKFTATLFVGATPQFEGFIQLKAVYQKAQVYEVVLMSNTADLFSAVGENRLRDVFLNDNGSYSDELDHTYTHANIIASWNGGSSSFQNTSGTSLRDVDSGVQKVMYPMSITTPKFFYETAANNSFFLNMDQAYIDAQGYDQVSDKTTPITQFRPALQLKNMLNLILEKAGFTYTSTFINGSYFGKLFMTTANNIEGGMLPTTTSTTFPNFSTKVGNDGQWGVYEPNEGGMPDEDIPIPEADLMTVVPADTESGYSCVSDTFNSWNTVENSFTKVSGGQIEMQVRHNWLLTLVSRVNSEEPVLLTVWLQDTSNPDLVYGDPSIITTSIGSGADNDSGFGWHYFDLSQMDIGATAHVYISITNIQFSSSLSSIKYGSNSVTTCGGEIGLYSKISVFAIPYSEGVYNGTINVPACIDENILQKDFLLDIVQRFNLVIISDPDNPENLIIEPYDNYIATGEIKQWTGKLDVSKEVIVKDTTSIQKKIIHFTDLEDTDLWNKALKEEAPEVNVYGHYKQINSTNEFASGELKNNSIFSPYINDKVFIYYDDEQTELPNMTVQYETTYNDDGNFIVPEKTKPKLFYYCGTATTVKNGNDDTVTYYMHNQVEALSELTAYSFTTYPVCSPFDITPSSDAYTLTSANKSLYWNANPPPRGELDVFNYTDETATWFANTLYGLYWQSYLNTIYDPNARIMECYLYLDDVDIHNFKFNDEVFIKNAYWRVLSITNYQVGIKTSTKVSLLKVVDDSGPCEDCDYVVGTDSTGSNLWNGFFYYWCPDTDPNCTPSVSALPLLGILAPESCCTCQGGESLTNFPFATGIFPCFANSGSLPINLKSLLGMRSILSKGQAKSIIFDKISGYQRQLVIGSDNGQYSSSILPNYADDMVIKYKTTQKGTPRLNGEMHRIVATGYTEGNTRGYAYPAGTKYNRKPFVPYNSNMIIRITGTATVIGGTSSTYAVGTTEGFSWYTAFKNVNGTITQLSTAGGQQEFSIREGANPTTCTLNIATTNGELQFGLDDSQTDTKRIWSLSVDLAVQRLPNIALPYGENWAIFQNTSNIQFMNFDKMLWN
tara:strand:+ start:3593 stop:7039 length:3447 start_codon:yes stop_codon:yes gene_type:complete